MKNPVAPMAGRLKPNTATTLAGVPDGFDGKVVADLARLAAKEGAGRLLFVARDGQRLANLERAIQFFAPDIATVAVPAWDSQPYDRVSPHAAIQARRMASLARLVRKTEGPLVVLTTVNAIIQRVPVPDHVAANTLSLAPGNRAGMNELAAWLARNGFNRTTTVREAGEFAIRGGLIDLAAGGLETPVRLDFFGDTLESVRSFDTETQRTTGQLKRLELVPTGEMTLDEESIRRFRQNYIALFGASGPNDLLYQAVSDGRRHPGMENWLALFLDAMATLFDYADGPVVLDYLADEAFAERADDIVDHYRARRNAMDDGKSGAVPYKPVPPERLYLDKSEWQRHLAVRPVLRLSPFQSPPTAAVVDMGAHQGRNFAPERQSGDINVFDAAIQHVRQLQKQSKRVVVAAWSEGARERLAQLLTDHGLERVEKVENFTQAMAMPFGTVPVIVLGLEAGFETDKFAIIGEQDILGDRLVRQSRRQRRNADFLTEANGLSEGDVVVHVDHGIGRFQGLKIITAAGAPHDCLELIYAGGDRLYLPVENVELLSRYGSDETEVQLDKLGGVAWQGRKARLKRRIREMAGQLIKVAAARALKTAAVLTAPEGLYDEFAARFPYDETDDQLTAIAAVMEDLAKGTPMDRLICGDVGFGKTEVALRAAFVAAMSGRQVAVVVPTTLLARQHTRTFTERFAGLPVRIGQLSRLVAGKEAAATKEALADGKVDIIIGTHALLAKAIHFRDLGLLIIDEEQHFGVRHKERLKELKADVHVLTLSATPIPRTLQLALAGVRELSLITTPPVDRLAVRTFVSPFDPLVVREALLRERYRGGQTFYVCPRIADLPDAAEFLKENVPEVKFAIAHGQLPPGELDDIMNAFYDGAYDVLLSTTIVESGLDVPSANTLIVHRADRFGLSQLYQLRGRVGRSKTRAYALFTVPATQTLAGNAERRLKVLQSLDTLGAGFQLASHDLDIRGAGNLLGEEQSGHIREVGYELYQQMLEEAVAELRAGGGEDESEGRWSPQITLGTAVMIPEPYVPDLDLRMALYRRLADLESESEIDAVAAEMIDRFGPLPEEVQHLLRIVAIKGLCRRANVERLDAGPKGLVITLRHSTFPNPDGLVRWITQGKELARLRPDQKIVISRDWERPEDRLKGTALVMAELARLAGPGEKAAA